MIAFEISSAVNLIKSTHYHGNIDTFFYEKRDEMEFHKQSTNANFEISYLVTTKIKIIKKLECF